VIDGERVFPESMDAAADGSLFFGSIGNKMVYRAAPGADKAVAFVQSGTDGLQSVFGVFVDNRSGTLYACSNAFGGPPGNAPPATVYAFDLKTGATKGHYPFAASGGFCNDMATTPDGTLYATDTNNMQVEVLKKGAVALTVWSGADGSLGKRGGVIDGISVLGNRIIVNELAVSKLFSIGINHDGTAAAPVEITLDRPLSRPDGMRVFGKSAVLIVEGGDGGKLEKITFDGNTGKVELIKQGYPDGPVAVGIVGTTAYVCQSQMAAMGPRRPGAPPGPVPALKPFTATAVEVGKP
jgi:sugar lactone lactonase YvrE